MKKLKIGDLEKIREKVRRTSSIRQRQCRAKVTVHMGTCGIVAGAKNILSVLMKELEKNKLDDVLVASSGCAGLCSREPMLTIEINGQPPVKYVDLTDDKIIAICKTHIIEGKILKKYALAIGCEWTY